MMERVRHEYITNLHGVSTDIMRMHMDPEFWYQQHNLDSDAHHLNRHIIDMVQKYKGEMQPEWKRTSSSVLWYTSTNTAREFLPEEN